MVLLMAPKKKQEQKSAIEEFAGELTLLMEKHKCGLRGSPHFVLRDDGTWSISVAVEVHEL
jgi:hypothetical protein